MLWLDDLFVLLLVVLLTSLSLIFHLFVANASTFSWWERLSLQRSLQHDEKKQFDRLDNAGLMQQVEARAHHMPTASDNCTFVLSEYSLPVCRSLWRIVEYVLSDFIDFWWVKISDSPEFGNDLRDVFDHAFNVLGERCIKVDWSPFIVKNVISNLNYLMRIYRLTEQEVSSHNRFFSDTPEAARHRLLKAELMRTYKLHVAVSNPQAYLRKISEAILSQLLRSSDYRSESARTLTREVLTTFIFLPVMKFVDPYWLNVGVITFLKLQQKEKEKEKEVAAAAGMNSEPNSATPAGMRPNKQKSSSNNHYPANVPFSQANNTSAFSPSHSRSNSPTRGGIFSAPVEGGKSLLADDGDAFEQSAHSLSNSTTNPLLDDGDDDLDGDSSFQPPLNYVPHRKESLLTQKMKEWEGEKKIRHEKKGKKGPSSRHTAAHHEHHHHSSHNISSSEHHSAEFDNSAAIVTPVNSIATPAANIPSLNPSTPIVYPSAFPTPLSSNWDVRIVGAGIRFDPKPFVMYQLLVKNDVDNLKWTIVKRYQKFEELHQKLKKAIPSFDAQLPKKTFFGNLDQSFIANRKVELQTYLGQLLWNKNVQENVDMQQFLLPSVEDNKWLQNTQGGSLASGTNSGMSTPTTTSSSISNFFGKKKDNPSMSPPHNNSSFPSSTPGTSDDTRTPPTGGQPHSYQPQHLHHHHSTSNLYSQSVMPADSSVLMPSASTMALSSNNPFLATLAEGNDADVFQSPSENGDSPSQYQQMARTRSTGVSGIVSDAATPSSPAAKHRVYPSDDLMQSPPHHKPGLSSTGGPSNSGLGSSLFSTNWEDKSLTDPLYLLVEEIFNLNGRGWMRRQATWVGKQLVKMTMDTLIKKQLNRQVESLLNEHTLTAQIDWVTELIWPNGKLFESKPPVDDKEKAAVKEEALKLLIQSIPTALKALMGKEHCVTAMEKCFQFIQMEPLIQHFAYSVLDSLVLELFPELTSVIGK